MADKKIFFMPGEDPGPYALGLPDQPAMAGVLAAYRLKMGKLPTGSKVAARFPWIRNVLETFTNGPEQRTIMRANWPATFVNNSDHRVQVEEIRFRYDIAIGDTMTYMTDLWAKIEIPDRRVINDQWLSVCTLNTENDRFLYANLDNYTYELPSPYFLQRGNPFFVDVQWNNLFGNAQPEDWVIMAGLHGWGQWDQEPISLIKPVRGWATVVGAAGQYQTAVFDDEQDRPMRDAWITHLTIGSARTTDFAGGLHQATFIRPQAPEGPPWHTNEFFRVDDLAEQVGALFTNQTSDTYVIHRPIIPYRLEPGEGVRVSLWNRSAQPTVNVSVTLRGYQEVP